MIFGIPAHVAAPPPPPLLASLDERTQVGAPTHAPKFYDVHKSQRTGEPFCFDSRADGGAREGARGGAHTHGAGAPRRSRLSPGSRPAATLATRHCRSRDLPSWRQRGAARSAVGGPGRATSRATRAHLAPSHAVRLALRPRLPRRSHPAGPHDTPAATDSDTLIPVSLHTSDDLHGYPSATAQQFTMMA